MTVNKNNSTPINQITYEQNKIIAMLTILVLFKDIVNVFV